MDVLQRISHKLPTLTKSQRRLAEYLLANWERAAYQSANSLAKQLGMSQSSVIRIAEPLGYDGFPALQKALQEAVQRRISTVSRVDRATLVHGQAGPEHTIAFVMRQDEANIKNTLRHLEPEQIRLINRLITSAKRIYVIGMRSSAALAHFFGFNLNLLLQNVRILTSDYGLIEDLRSVSPDDVVIAISFPRYTRLTIEGARFAKEHGCKLIGITDAPASPLAGMADLLLVAETSSAYFNLSYAAVMALFDVLLTDLAVSFGDKHLREFGGFEKALERFKIFED